jgi:hypothetical protein
LHLYDQGLRTYLKERRGIDNDPVAAILYGSDLAVFIYSSADIGVLRQYDRGQKRDVQKQ